MQYTLTIRDGIPTEEIRSGLRYLADNYGSGLTANSLGEIILWSDHAYNIGYLKMEEN
jgi:hypothetical protein